MKKFFKGLFALLLTASMLASCGSGGESTNDAGYKSETNGGYVNGTTVNDSSSAVDDSITSRKIIKTYRVRMETLEYDKAVATITSETEAYGGYIAKASQDGYATSTSERIRTATFTVRVPAEYADAYLERISGDCNVLSSSLDTEDVTDSYYGYKAQLDSLVIQEERLLAMMEKATYLSELLELEDKLTDVRAEINGIHSQLQLMDKSVEYSYIYLTLNEVEVYQEPEAESYLARVGNSFVSAFKSFADVIGEIFIGFIWVLPYLIVMSGIIVVAVLCTNRARERRLIKMQEKQNHEEKKDEK